MSRYQSIAVIYGSDSSEWEVSCRSGEFTASRIDEFRYDVYAIQYVESIAAPYGVGRDMHVGDTIIGIKGRVGFEAAAPMLIISAHKFLEKFTLSKWQQYWKDQVANWYGMFLHESQYLEPVMRDIEAMLESSQRNVNGVVSMQLQPYCFSTVGVESKDDLVKTKFGEYGEMQISPQMNMFSVGIQIKIVVGLMVMLITVTMLGDASNFIFNNMKELMQEFVYSMQRG